MSGKQSYPDAVAAFRWDEARGDLGWSHAGPVSLGEAIVDRRARSGKTALISIARDGTERRVTYARLAEESGRFAAALKRLGIRPGDRVAGLMPRGPEALVVIVGALKAGAVYVPLFTGFGRDAVRYRLTHSGSAVLVTHGSVRGQVPDGTGVRIVCVQDGSVPPAAGDLDFAAVLAAETVPAAAERREREDPAAIIYTSGSTGQPKGGLLAVNFLAAVRPYIRYGLDLREDDVLWPTGDPGWGYGFVCYLGGLAAGATLVCLEANPTAETCLSALGRYGVTNLATTPTLLRSLMASGEEAVRGTTTRLRAVSSCGEPLNGKVVEFFRAVWDLTPMDHFGATEYALPIGNHNALDMAVKPGSMGLPCPGYRMAILDEGGAELAPGQVGLIGQRSDPDRRYWLRYWNDPEASAALVETGWIVAGDLGRTDEDGYFWFEGRTGDMIKSAGYRIGPFEIESALLKHPAVAEAAVIGKPDEARGQIVKAFVTLRDGHAGNDALAAELVELVRTDLGRHQYPRELEFVQALPKTETGKIQRFALRERA